MIIFLAHMGRKGGTCTCTNTSQYSSKHIDLSLFNLLMNVFFWYVNYSHQMKVFGNAMI